MGKLYIDEYTKVFAGKRIFIACREGILRNYFSEIIEDIKCLDRQGIKTTLLHNMSNRFANQKHFKLLALKLPNTKIIKVLPEVDFYSYVLSDSAHAFKLIFIERKFLMDNNGQRINALTTESALKFGTSYGDLISNINFKRFLMHICKEIEQGHYERIHILPAGKHSIKKELFSIEGTGTLIANNFTETFCRVDKDEETKVIAGILDLYKNEGFLKLRNRDYLLKNKENFYVTKIDEIIVGCVEKKSIDTETVELGALAISTRFKSQRIGSYTVKAFIHEMKNLGYQTFISLTNNYRLAALYSKLGFVHASASQYPKRQAKSPKVKMFILETGIGKTNQ